MFNLSYKNWRKIVSRGKYPSLFIYELAQGLKNTHKITGFKTRMQTYCRTSRASYLYESEAQAAIKEIRKILQRNPGKTLSWLEQYHQQSKRLFIWISRINRQIATHNFSESELQKFYQQFERNIQYFWRWAYLPFLMDEALNLEIYDLFAKLGAKQKEIPNFLKILATAPQGTMHHQEEIELLKLSQRIKKFGWKKEAKGFNEHLEKWAWKNSWVYFYQPLTKKTLKEEIAKIIQKDPIKIIRDIQQGKKRELIARERLLAYFHHHRLKVLADILTQYALWHSLKMEEASKAVYLVRRLFTKLADKLNLSYEEFIELLPREVIKDDVSPSRIRARLKNNGALMCKGVFKILTGEELKKTEVALEYQAKTAKILRGFATFGGKVMGKVKIVSERDDIAHAMIKPGDILVAAMTNVNMTPLIKKASAIITDEGGILSHAAILSRELQIPAIVGTKIATQVLQDGQMVEVDANRGVVKILNL